MNFSHYQEKFDALALRERLLVLAVMLALVYALWTLAFDTAQARQTNRLNQQLADAQVALRDQKRALNQLKARNSVDPDAALKQELARLQYEIAQMDQRLSEASVGLVPAQKLPRVLEEMVLKTSGLRLEQVETLPIEQLKLVQAQDAQEAEQTQTGIYKHAVKIRLKGSYFAVQNYLQALQQLDWRFYWQQLDYEVQRYPTGVAELVVYTLSTERGAIGE